MHYCTIMIGFGISYVCYNSFKSEFNQYIVNSLWNFTIKQMVFKKNYSIIFNKKCSKTY